MKKITASLFCAALATAFVACSDSSSTAASGAVPGNTSAILQPSDCARIMKVLPVQPSFAYTMEFDGDVCMVTPATQDTAEILQYFETLYAAGEAIGGYSYKDLRAGYLEYEVEQTVVFRYRRPSVTNEFSFELENDCGNAVRVANIPEKDSLWVGSSECVLYSDNEYDLRITQAQLNEKMAYLTNSGWTMLSSCPFEGGGVDICFQKQIDDYVFAVGYETDEDGLLLGVDVVFDYEKIQ